MAFSVLCVSISDTLHPGVALIGNSFRPGNSLIVTRTTYTGSPGVVAFTVVAALERTIGTASVPLKRLIYLTRAQNQLSLVDGRNKFRETVGKMTSEVVYDMNTLVLKHYLLSLID